MQSDMTKDSNAPIFQSIFGEQWKQLPPVMHKHYAVRPHSDNAVVVEGALDVKASWFVKVIGKLFGVLVPADGHNIPVTVRFSSNGAAFCFDRAFHYPNRQPYHFRSRMVPIGGNEVIEVMRFGFGWHCAYDWDGQKVILSHKGYVWHILGRNIPLPLGLLIGTGHAEEHSLSDNTFSMWTHTKHRWFGEMFRYEGKFEVTKK